MRSEMRRQIGAVLACVLLSMSLISCRKAKEPTQEAAEKTAQEAAQETAAEEPAQESTTGSAQSGEEAGTETVIPEEAVEFASPLLPGFACSLESSHEVDGRQGVAWTQGRFYVSGSTSLSCYDADWNLEAQNDAPFEGADFAADHIGDIDVYKGEIYAGTEHFADGEASDIRIAVFDAKTLELKRTIPFDETSGQAECSGIAVDPDSKSIWLCSWAEGDSGRFVYRYDLTKGTYAGKIALKDAPRWIQGAAYYDGWLYLTADDGEADEQQPDHVYRCRVDASLQEWDTVPVHALEEVAMQGEIEGISFDQNNKRMLVSYNHGAKIVKGMATGFYEGYSEEIHEVYSFDLARIFRPLDYSLEENWAKLPAETDKGADVFFVLPSVNMKALVPDNEDLYNLKGARRFVYTLNMEEGIVSGSCNVYAPLYRQATVGSQLDREGKIPQVVTTRVEANDYTKNAYEDVRDAFIYYREHLGAGRPFVLFGYSQGSQMAFQLLREFGDDEEFRKDLVAAYLPGITILEEDIAECPYLKMAEGETDTGVIVCFNAMDENAGLPDTKEYSINPLNWRTDSTPADKSLNLGYATVDTYGKVTEEIPAYCGAVLDEKTGRLLVSGIEGQEVLFEADPGLLYKGDYHLYDLWFFYRNLQKNVADRVAAHEGR